MSHRTLTSVASPRTSELRSWLTAIGTLTAAVNAGHRLSTLLDLVAATAQDLLGLDFCGVMLPSADGASLAIAGASALPDQYVGRVDRGRLIPLEPTAAGGAPASRAFRSGRPCSVADVAAEPDSAWTEVAREQGYGSILAVPLVTRAGVLGTLNSYRSTAHEFGPQEVEQLELLAEHAAIALTSARIVDDLREQHRLIVRSVEIHDRLVRVAARSGGVSGITAALHDLLGCDVVVRDAHGETIAAEAHPPATAPGAAVQAPQPPRAQGQRGLVREEGPHVVADVVLDGSVSATVWLLDQAGRLDPLGVRAVEHAAVVLSLELLRQRTAAEVEQTLRGELLADLLAGTDPGAPSVRERAKLMGHHLGVPHQTLVAEAPRPSGGGTSARAARSKEEIAQRAAAEAVRVTSHLRPRPLIAAVRDVVVALWPAAITRPRGDEVLRRAIEATHGATTTVAVSGPDSDGFPAAYRVARGALAFAAAAGDGEIRGALTLDDLGAAGLLLRYAEPAELRRYAERTLGAVRRYDADHGAELVRTLRVFLDCDLDRRATAERLVLHPNTVSQRLRRIETLTGLDLRSPRSVIDARTALMLIDVVDAVAADAAAPPAGGARRSR
jgi:sugar diacid utilization regulator